MGRNPFTDTNRNQFYYLNGIKKRSKQIIQVPISLEDPTNMKDFYKNYNGNLETNLKYKEFYGVGNTYKNQIMIFNKMD